MRTRTLGGLLGLWLLVGAGGCAASAEVESGAMDAAGGFPADLSVEVLVVRGRDAPWEWPTHLRPARFVLFPDGSLHYEPLEQRRAGAPASIVAERQLGALSREEMAEAWALVEALGLADPASGQLPFNFDLYAPSPGGTAYLVTIAASGERWSYLGAWEGDPPIEAPSVQLVRRLGELVWLSDRPRPRVTRFAPRYDFGPDPYARFREP